LHARILADRIRREKEKKEEERSAWTPSESAIDSLKKGRKERRGAGRIDRPALDLD